MAIELITGLPGNGKTLYTIGEVKKRAEAENRKVYCAGFKELTLDWEVIDPTNWMDVPSGSIIVIDECQKIFRNRSMGSQPPAHVTELEEHRHKGLDFYLITQHPSLIDPAIRRLTQTHKHLIRIFGMEASTIHKWNACIANPDLNNSRKDSEKQRWGFDKSLYGLYKSADMHTMKRSIPLRLKLLLLVPVILIAAIYYIYSITVGKHPAPLPRDAAPVVAVDAAPDIRSSARDRRSVSRHGGSDSEDSREAEFDPVADARRFVAMSTPRVEGLAYTAPKYDHITKPVRAPIPAMCIKIGNDRCKCYSQQATPLEVPFNMCLSFALNGAFQEFDADGERSREDDRARRSVQSVRDLDARGVKDTALPSQVSAFTNPPRDAPTRPMVGKGS